MFVGREGFYSLVKHVGFTVCHRFVEVAIVAAERVSESVVTEILTVLVFVSLFCARCVKQC